MSSHELKTWLESVRGPVVWNGPEGRVRCPDPLHEDKHASCDFNAEKGTFICRSCGAKGDARELARLLGVAPPGEDGQPKAESWAYVKAGAEFFRKKKWYKDGEKHFSIGRYVNGEWVPDIKGVPRILYNHDGLLLAFEAGEPVFICEGEKDADALIATGKTATCNFDGAVKAGKWKKSYTAMFPAGHLVYIIGDCDVAGQGHVQIIGAALSEQGCDVRVVKLPYPIVKKDGKDISDWLAEAHKAKEFDELIDQAVEFTPAAEPTLSSNSPHLTDQGNAERLVARFGDQMRYCEDFGGWVIYDGKRWQRDRTKRAEALAKETVRAMYAEAATLEDEGERKRLAAHAIKCESRHRIVNMLAMAASEPGVAVMADSFDTQPFLLNCKNCTVDLTTGKLSRHNPADLLMKMVNADYDPRASCPRWEKFLLELMDDDIDMVLYLQRAFGYSASGDVSENVFFLMHGQEGWNGKTTLGETYGDVLGDYSFIAPIETFLAKRYESVPNDLAALKGSRFVLAVEPRKGVRFDEGRLKQLTGGDQVSARFMRAEFFSFHPECKIWIAANDRPHISETKHSIWRRVRELPFTVTIPPEKRNPHMKEYLLEERDGILAWVVQGCLRWQKHGLGSPEKVTAAVEEYRRTEDTLQDFITDYIEQVPSAETRGADLYAAYRKYAETEGIRKPWLANKQFAEEMQSHGFRKTHTKKGAQWIGITLKPFAGEGDGGDGGDG